MEFFIAVVGMVLIVEGIPWFLSPEKTKSFLSQIQLLSDRQLRVYGFVLMVVGLMIVRFATE